MTFSVYRLCVSYRSRYHWHPHCTEVFTRGLLIGQSITGLLVTRTCLERGCGRVFHKRQKQKKSEMKGLILIRLTDLKDTKLNR